MRKEDPFHSEARIIAKSLESFTKMLFSNPKLLHPRSTQMSSSEKASSVEIVPQSITAPLTRAAIFLAVTINAGDENASTVRLFCGDLSSILRAVGFRSLGDNLSCVMSIGSDAWDRLFAGRPKPAELHPFKELRSENRYAPATPGDLLFHIRANHQDLCFELATQVMAKLGNSVTSVDEVHGFRYFDSRDLLGFVDGTENPSGQLAYDSTIVGEEDKQFTGGSYVITQKYLHDLAGWNALDDETQEKIIGRKKLSDIELDDDVKPTSAHSALNTIKENGKEIKILRDNMPFGEAGKGEFGTYFIGYSRSPRTTEQMLQNMFIGRPDGNYDRILDFSHAVTGNLFFAPSVTFLDSQKPD
jgi:porphyrinogen peroxidase